MAGTLARAFEKAFRRKLLLKPMPNGGFEAVDITGNDEYVQKEDGSAVVLSPNRIYPVSGIKNIAYIAIKQFNKAELHNPFDQDTSGITEKAMWDIIDNTESYARNMAEGTGDEGKKIQSKATITMIAAIAAAIFSVMIYLKVGM